MTSLIRIISLSVMVLLVYSKSAIAINPPPEESQNITVEYANELVEYLMQSGFDSQDLPDLKRIDSEINKWLSEDKNNPVVYTIKGRLLMRYLSVWHKEMKRKQYTREQRQNDPRYNQLKNDANIAFEKALNLDENENVSMHLTIKMLDAITIHVLTSADNKVTALRRSMERVKKFPEERPPGIDGFESYSYRHMVRAYMDEKRYDEALSILEEMKEKFTNPKSLKKFNEAIVRIEDRKAKAMQQAKALEDNQVAESKPQQVQKVADKPQTQKMIPEPPKKQAKMISEPKPQQSDTNKAPLISLKLVLSIAIMAAVTLGAFIYFRRKKQ